MARGEQEPKLTGGGKRSLVELKASTIRLAVPQTTIFSGEYTGSSIVSVPFPRLAAATILAAGELDRNGNAKEVPGALRRDERVRQDRLYVSDYGPYANCTQNGKSPLEMNTPDPRLQLDRKDICKGCLAQTVCFAEAAQGLMDVVDAEGSNPNQEKILSEHNPGVRAGMLPDQLYAAVTKDRAMTEIMIGDVAGARPFQDGISSRLQDQMSQ